MTVTVEMHPPVLFGGALHENTFEEILGAEPDPEHVAVVSAIIEQLRTNMTDDQINYWFWQPRVILGGRRPVEALAGGQWGPEDDDVKKIIEAASSPLCGGAQALHPGRSVASCPRCG